MSSNLDDVQNSADRLTALAHAAVSVGLYAADRCEEHNRRTLERLGELVGMTARELDSDIDSAAEEGKPKAKPATSYILDIAQLNEALRSLQRNVDGVIDILGQADGDADEKVKAIDQIMGTVWDNAHRMEQILKAMAGARPTEASDEAAPVPRAPAPAAKKRRSTSTTRRRARPQKAGQPS